MYKVKKLLKNNKGFTMIEAVLGMFLISVILLVIFNIVVEINNTDKESKEMNFTSQLLEPYLSYYKNIEVKESLVSTLLSDIDEVDLVKEAETSNTGGKKGLVPNSLKGVKLVCENSPEVKGDYMVFNIKCEKNGRSINKGNSFVITKFIN